MGKYTILDDPAADRAVQDVLDMVVEGVIGLMGIHVRAIVLIGGLGRGEGGIYNDGDGYKLVNDLDLAVFVEKNFGKVKKKYNARLKELAVELQPKAKGIKQIDVDITNSRRLRFVPNLVSYYEIKHGHKIIYGDLNLYDVMPSMRAENLPLFDGTIYFYSRGSGLLLPAVYFLTNTLDLLEIRENFQIELQKACQAMGDAVLLMAEQYHYSYRERLRRFNLIKRTDDLLPSTLMTRVSPLYRWGVERKLNPSFEWHGNEAMVEQWFNIRDVFGEFFLWFESKRLKNNFNDWTEYSDFVFKQGIFEPRDVWFRDFIKRVDALIKSAIKGNLSFEKKSKMADLLPIMPQLLFSFGKDIKTDSNQLSSAVKYFKIETDDEPEHVWLNMTRNYLNKFHPGGASGQASKMEYPWSSKGKG